jgi:hypothetical protein
VPTFALKSLALVKTNVPLRCVVKTREGGTTECFYDASVAVMKQSTRAYSSEIKTLEIYLERLTNNQKLPPGRIKQLDQTQTYTTYELRSKHLRLYFFKTEKLGIVVVHLTLKDPKQQGRDIARFNSLVEDFLTTYSHD